MNRKRLDEIRRELASMRRRQPKARELHELAKALGAREVNRGKEPTFASDSFPWLRPISIPNHKGRDIPTGTRNNILNQLEDYLAEWDQTLSEEE